MIVGSFKYKKNSWFLSLQLLYWNQFNFQTVSSDYELQSWVSDVANEGIGWQNKDTKGFPSNLTKKEDLVSNGWDKRQWWSDKYW